MRFTKNQALSQTVLAYLLPFAAYVIWTDLVPGPRIKNQLQSHLPWFLSLNTAIILVSALAAAPSWRRIFSSIPKSLFCKAGGISFLAFILAGLAAPRMHHIYYDEDIYLHIGQNIARFRQAALCNEGDISREGYVCRRPEYNKEPNAWPHLASLVFRIAGVDEKLGFWINASLFALSAWSLFLLGFLIFGESAGLYAAAVYTLIPLNAWWHSSASAEPGAAFAAALALLSLLAALRDTDLRSLWLALALLPWAAQFRPESIMVYGTAAAGILLLKPALLKNRSFHIMAGLSLILLVPHLAHMQSVGHENWGSAGPKFSAAHAVKFWRSNVLYYFDNERFPALFSALALLGLAVKSSKEGFRLKAKAWLASWFLPFYLIFLFFYAGGYQFGVNARFSLMSYAPLALAAGGGCLFLEKQTLKFRFMPRWLPQSLILAGLLGAFSPFLSLLRSPNTQILWPAHADHEFAKKMAEKLPENSIILTHNPSMFLLWGKSAAQASLATTQPRLVDSYFQRYPAGVYFHYNFWCNAADPLQNRFCSNILSRFDADTIVSFQEQNYHYRLYRLNQTPPAGLSRLN